MSKKNVFSFLFHAAKNDAVKSKLNDATTQAEMMLIAQEIGYNFSSEHVDGALDELKQQPGFFGAIAEAALEIFSPNHDNYPATSLQPFSGDPNP